MTLDPYKNNRFVKNPYYQKSDVSGRLVAILDGRLDNRGLELLPQPSRCVCRYQVHELILTDQKEASPGGRVDQIAYLGFCSITEEGVVVAGDEVYLDGVRIGTLLGYDETHMPNHLNIIIFTDDMRTGKEIRAGLGAEIRFKSPAT